ncbi:hypothetical protein LTR85_006993 [Meristemomyces frigidus]|nr:hypothetical protein LTR85_006993 [Meristemomyces frigidus]
MLLSINASEAQKKASETFVYLCSLTQVLGEILPLVYKLHGQQDLWCTIESADLSTKRTCTEKLVKLRGRLVKAQWDLADFCLERCEEPITKISAAMGLNAVTSGEAEVRTHEPAAGAENFVTTRNAEDSMMDPAFDVDVFLPADSLDFPWETLWDTFDDAGTIGVWGQDY